MIIYIYIYVKLLEIYIQNPFGSVSRLYEFVSCWEGPEGNQVGHICELQDICEISDICEVGSICELQDICELSDIFKLPDICELLGRTRG